MPEYSIDELIITCMARELHGEVIVTSVTTLGALAAHLAKNTHAPDLAVLSTPESGMDAIPMPTLSLGQFLRQPAGDPADDGRHLHHVGRRRGLPAGVRNSRLQGLQSTGQDLRRRVGVRRDAHGRQAPR